MQTRSTCKEKSVWILMEILDKGIQLGLSLVDGCLIVFMISSVMTLCGLDVRTSLWGVVLAILSLVVIHVLADGLLGMGYQQGKQRRGLHNCEKPPTPPQPQKLVDTRTTLEQALSAREAARRHGWDEDRFPREYQAELDAYDERQWYPPERWDHPINVKRKTSMT